MQQSAIDILCEQQCELGEGPFYCSRRDTVFWFDILAKKRHAYDFSTDTKSVLLLPEMASAMAVIDDRTDLILTESGLWSLSVATGAFAPVASIEADDETTRSNDARVHSSGAFWVSTMGKNAEPNAGAIYHFRRGKLTKLFSDVTIPNSICFAPDGATAYYTDNVTQKLMTVDADPDTGLPTGEPRVLVDHSGQKGGLDGAIVDTDGNILIALWGAGQLNHYAPNGTLINTIRVPVTQPTCSAFVGKNKIVVTSARRGMNTAAKIC
ncbi:MAG: SMP-30/gluconolactonase/LRE family protein [Ahrensia sp.]|nr:SMP-30/gluconolactonase/LRE family protein [Ahrensia sp.]